MYRAVQGSNFGWPFCFYDYGLKKLLLNPEYGGDGKEVGRCTEFTPPVAAFPAHWAPVDLMFYSGNQFPKKYQDGAFIAFHGSWNRSPMPQDGYNVTFQPFAARQAVRRLRGVRAGLRRQGSVDEPQRRRRAGRRPRAGA